MKLPIFRRLKRWRAIILMTVVGAIVLFIFISGNHPGVTRVELICGLPIFLFLVWLLWLIYFSQFIVPLRQVSDRMQIFVRLLLFPTPLHGQTVFIENGEEKQTAEELDRTGIGVAVLDTTSAALLETSVQPSRAIGPGVTFIQYNERLGTRIDIRPRKKFLGPKDGVDDPFAPKQPDESQPEYDARMRRKAETRAFTRDGIEVVPNIFVKFRLDAPPRTGNTPFGFNPDSVIAALASRDVNTNVPRDSIERLTDWDWLPAKIATDVWRELLAFFRLKELFSSLDPKNPNGPTGLSLINDVLRQRMTQNSAPVLVFNADGASVIPGPSAPSKEFTLLKRRGIQVNVCTMLNLRFESSIENTLVQDWAASWLQRARADREQQIQERGLNLDSARGTGRVNFAASISGTVAQSTFIDGNDLMSLLLRGSDNLFIRYPALLQIAAEERQALSDIQEWIQSDQT